MAGLNFVGNAAYAPLRGENIAQFEFIPGFWPIAPICGKPAPP